MSSVSDHSCRCERYGVTRSGQRVKLDCGGKRCGGWSSSSSECDDDSSEDSSEDERDQRARMRREAEKRSAAAHPHEGTQWSRGEEEDCRCGEETEIDEQRCIRRRVVKCGRGEFFIFLIPGKITNTSAYSHDDQTRQRKFTSRQCTQVRCVSQSNQLWCCEMARTNVNLAEKGSVRVLET